LAPPALRISAVARLGGVFEGVVAAALNARPRAIRERAEDLLGHRSGPGGLARDDDLRGITAERRDIALDPLQRRVLIEVAVIARVAALLLVARDAP
jgi:hypothetical protein